MKTRTLTQTGWIVTGYIWGSFWMGGEGIYPIPPKHIPLGELTKTALISSIKDEFGFQDIMYAHLYIDIEYDYNYQESSNRDIFLENTAQGWRLLRDDDIENKIVRLEMEAEGFEVDDEEEV